MTTFQDNAVELASWSEEIAPAPWLLLAPGSRARRSPYYRLPSEMPWSPASTRVSSTRKAELGMDHQVASQYPALRQPMSRAMEC
jgi:hypothetical protein